jgi:NAD-dependent SIR2 family protein deacetylase
VRDELTRPIGSTFIAVLSLFGSEGNIMHSAWVDGDELTKLAELTAPGGVMVLSGAGISTESGIPDYRGPTGAQRRQSPMLFQTFIADAAARCRYWARSYLGWRRIARAVPNDGHAMVAQLENLGLLTGVVTQNVDGLHQAAGSRLVTDLHGHLSQVDRHRDQSGRRRRPRRRSARRVHGRRLLCVRRVAEA